jgi:hypothetical protein
MLFTRRFLLATSFAISAYALLGCNRGVEGVAKSLNTTRSNAVAVEKVADLGTADVQKHREPEPQRQMQEDEAYYLAFLKRQEERYGVIGHYAREIQQAADEGQVAATHTTDKTPNWLTGLKYIAYVVAPLGILILLWQTGVIGWLRGVIGLVTPRTRVQAKMDAEIMAGGGATPEQHAAVAVRRTDPAYNVLYSKAKNAAEAEASSSDETPK